MTQEQTDTTTVYVIVGENQLLQTISARAVYTRREDAESHLRDPERMWFDNRATIVALVVDKGAA